ncbi:MAG: hypothetical protein LIO62_02730 [Clostridiales bacterium]|nr:hypothetical protein [Clostridiales bacterium]
MKALNFIGNEKTVEQLGALIDANRFPHAVLIEGEEGIGKRTLARLLAAALVCRESEKPCGECSQCRKAMENIHPDIFEYSATGGSRSFHVDTVRQVINDVYIQPNEADYKVYILGNADCMNESAQNAILKVLEEPPSYAVFLLTAVSKSAMLQTILSRCVTVTLEGVDIDEAVRYITNRDDFQDVQALKNALQTFNGNIGKALDSLQDSKSFELVEVCNNICKSLVSGSEYSVLTACSAFQKDRQSVVFAADLMKNIFRDSLVSNNDGNIISGQNETVKLLKSSLTRNQLVNLISVCDEIKKSAQMNGNNALIITKMCYDLRRAVGS